MGGRGKSAPTLESTYGDSPPVFFTESSAMPERRNHFAVIWAVCFGLMAFSVFAQPGGLDRSFGAGLGETAIDFGSNDRSESMVLQADGKIVIAGTCGGTIYGLICVARLLESGELDTSFGVGGKFIASDADGAYGVSYVRQVSVGVDSLQRIVIASECGGLLCVRRLTSQGQIDTTFGLNGLSRPLPFVSLGTTSALQIAIASTGKILVVSHCLNACSIRLLPNGALDLAFGSSGVQDSSLDFWPQALTLLPGDEYLVSGFCQNFLPSRLVQTHCTAKFFSNGSVDTSFGVAGIAKANTETEGLAFANSRATTGDFFVGGGCGTPLDNRWNLCVLKFGSTGQISSAFGVQGVASAGIEGEAHSVAIDSRGRILAAGTCALNNLEQRCLARFTNVGALDVQFGDGGYVRLPKSAYRDWFSNVRLDALGKIVLGGTYATSGWDFSVVRMHSVQNFFDLDYDNESKPDTDAILYLRHLLGFHDTALTSGALGTYADRTSAADIATYLSTPNSTYPNCSASIVGAPGGPQAMLDGIVLLRAMMGLTGDVVTNGIAFPAGTTRTAWVDIRAHLNGNCGMALN